jgi:hypothetical protein
MSSSLPRTHARRQPNFARRAVAHAKPETARYHLLWPSASAFIKADHLTFDIRRYIIWRNNTPMTNGPAASSTGQTLPDAALILMMLHGPGGRSAGHGMAATSSTGMG